jgi:hypothetical protein
MWDKIKTNLARFDHRPPSSSAAPRWRSTRPLHWEGRPFFVSDGALDRIADIVEAYREAPSETEAGMLAQQQLAKLDPSWARRSTGRRAVDRQRSPVPPGPARTAQAAPRHRPRRARRRGVAIARRRQPPAVEVLCDELPWRAVHLHSRVVPVLERAATSMAWRRSAAPPTSRRPTPLVPAWRLFADSCEQTPALKDRLPSRAGLAARRRGLRSHRRPCPTLLVVPRAIAAHGSSPRAARAGEGPAAGALLRKIKECATYAAKEGFGYLEASGIEPPGASSNDALN